MSQALFKYGKDPLSVGLAIDLARGKTIGILDDDVRIAVQQNRNIVESIVHKKKIVYGINTGFGPLCTTLIGEEDTRQLQYNLLMSHSVGVGESIDPELAKLMMIFKVHALAKGYSGIAPETLDRIIWHIHNEVVPCVPEQGSVGASGDLAPLSHLFLPLIGMGTVQIGTEILPAAEALHRFGLEPVQLGPKEGLALINGTQFMLAHAARLVERLQNCLDHADLTAAMNLEAMMGSFKSFDPQLHELRPYAGNQYVAERILKMLKNSEIEHSHENCTRVQDPYSLRCVPQVHGASRNAWLHLKQAVEIEMNSVTDNPIIFSEDKTITGGHFHGQPIALPMDYAAMAAAEIGNMADRRIYLSMIESVPGLPKLLMKTTGLNSGFMILQYTTAALVTENKTLCFPASVDSIPTSLGQEDHVSMGSISGRKALKVVDNLEKILGIELLTAAQGFEFRKPLKSGVIMDACHALVRSKIDFAESDRLFSPDIEKAIALVKSKALLQLAEEVALKHHIDFKNERHELFGIY